MAKQKALNIEDIKMKGEAFLQSLSQAEDLQYIDENVKSEVSEIIDQVLVHSEIAKDTLSEY